MGLLGLLQEIRDGLVDPNTDVSTLLRKCLVLATRLDHEGFKKWAEHELNGYTSAGDLPPYRLLPVESFGDFDWNGTELRAMCILADDVPEEYQKLVTTRPVLESVGSLVSLIRECKARELMGPWPPDLTAMLPLKITLVPGEKGSTCWKAWHVISRRLLAGIVDTVRNRVLSFVLEIERHAPDAGDVEPGTKPIPEERVAQIYQTYIPGATNVALRSFRSIQTARVQSGDLEGLRKYLTSLGVKKWDLGKLEEALEKDSAPPDGGWFSEKVSIWFGKMMSKTTMGTWDIAPSVAADKLVAGIRAYYGLAK